MTAIVTPLRLDRLQQSLFEVIGEAVAPTEVHWAYTQPTREQLPANFIELQMIGGPGPFVISGKRGTPLHAISTVTLEVDSVTAGQRYSIILNDFSHFYDAVGGDTPTDVALAIAISINADTYEDVTATPSSATVALVAGVAGAIRALATLGDISVAAGPAYYASYMLLTEGTETMLINLQAYSQSAEPRDGAWAIIKQAQAALQSEDLVETLRAYGVGSWDKGQPTDISAVAGANWESRVSVDLTFAMRSSWARFVDVIETVEGIITLTDQAGNTVATTTYEQDA